MLIKSHLRKLSYGFKYLNDTSSLTEEQIQFQQGALQFAQTKLLPFAGEWDRKHHFPKDVLREAAQQGYASIYTSAESGGCGLDRQTASLIFEALSYGCISSAAYLTIHNMTSYMIDTFGSEEQKALWLPQMQTLEKFSSYCLTEPNSGSDSRAMKTTAKFDGSDYILNGSKCFISGGSVSDYYLVMCKTNENEVSCFLVEKGTPGLSFGKLEEKMGWRSSPTTMVMFDNVRVPARNLINNKGMGFKMAMSALDGGRINIGSCSLGGAALAFDIAKDYMLERTQFGKKLADFQYLQFRLADMATSLTTSRLIIRHAAKLVDEKSQDKTIYSAMAKRYATDTCSKIADDALQIHGGYGYLSDYPLERIVRDLRVHQILEGTNEIMRLIISRQLLKE